MEVRRQGCKVIENNEIIVSVCDVSLSANILKKRVQVVPKMVVNFGKQLSHSSQIRVQKRVIIIITLFEDGKMHTDQSEVADIMNEYFVNIATHIGDINRTDFSDHPSITAIKTKLPQDKDSFDFQQIELQ